MVIASLPPHAPPIEAVRIVLTLIALAIGGVALWWARREVQAARRRFFGSEEARLATVDDNARLRADNAALVGRNAELCTMLGRSEQTRRALVETLRRQQPTHPDP
jgi:hypothetical protein